MKKISPPYKIYRIDEDTLRSCLFVMLGGTIDDLRSVLIGRRFTVNPAVVDDVLGNSPEVGIKASVWYGTEEDAGWVFVLLWLPDDIKDEEIVHEIVHVVMCKFNNASIPIRKENDEIFAYHMGFWYKKVQDLRKKHYAKKYTNRSK